MYGQGSSLHFFPIPEEREFDPVSTVRKYLTVQTEGLRKVKRTIGYYNPDMILAIG